MVGVEVRVQFITADGDFSESFVSTLSGGLGTAVGWNSPAFRIGDLHGTWDPALPGYSDVSFDMVPIPGGTYLMGSPSGEKGRKDDEGPQHPVTIKPFWMGK